MIQDYKLAALVHSQLVADVVHNEILRLGWDIHIEVTSYETALQDAASLLEQGYEALLCHGGFREELFARFGPCIVFIERSDIDLIKSLAEARKISTTVALTAHVNETRDIEFMEQLLDMRARLETALRDNQPSQKLTGHGNLNHRFRDIQSFFVVSNKTSPTHHPAKGSFHHPTVGKWLKSLLEGMSLYDFNNEIKEFCLVH